MEEKSLITFHDLEYMLEMKAHDALAGKKLDEDFTIMKICQGEIEFVSQYDPHDLLYCRWFSRKAWNKSSIYFILFYHQ